MCKQNCLKVDNEWVKTSVAPKGLSLFPTLKQYLKANKRTAFFSFEWDRVGAHPFPSLAI